MAKGWSMAGVLQLQLSEAGADTERVDALTGLLRQELLQLDVDDVAAQRAGEPPPGARALDVLAVGGLLVSLGNSAALRSVVAAVRQWLSRGGEVRRSVRMEIDGDVLELSDVAEADQQRLISTFLARHATE